MPFLALHAIIVESNFALDTKVLSLYFCSFPYRNSPRRSMYAIHSLSISLICCPRKWFDFCFPFRLETLFEGARLRRRRGRRRAGEDCSLWRRRRRGRRREQHQQQGDGEGQSKESGNEGEVRGNERRISAVCVIVALATNKRGYGAQMYPHPF